MILPLSIRATAQAPEPQKTINVYTGEDSVISKIAWERFQYATTFVKGNYRWRLMRVPTERALNLANKSGALLVRSPKLKSLAPTKSDNLQKIPIPLFSTNLVAYSHVKRKEFSGWKSLNQFHNGIERGIKILNKIPNPFYFKNLKHGFALLSKKRIDTVVCFETKGDSFIAREKMTGIYKLNPPLKKIEGFPYISRDHEELIAPLSEGIRKGFEDGTFQKISEKFLK